MLLIRNADIYVRLFRYEGKAVTLLRHWFWEKPFLITNYPTAASQLEDGRDGVFCESSVKGLAKGIATLFNNSELSPSLINNIIKKNCNSYELDKLYWIIGEYLGLGKGVVTCIK